MQVGKGFKFLTPTTTESPRFALRAKLLAFLFQTLPTLDPSHFTNTESTEAVMLSNLPGVKLHRFLNSGFNVDVRTVSAPVVIQQTAILTCYLSSSISPISSTFLASGFVFQGHTEQRLSTLPALSVRARMRRQYCTYFLRGTSKYSTDKILMLQQLSNLALEIR